MNKVKNIAIFGTGAIGSVIATFLQKSNQDQTKNIHLIGRKSTLEIIKEKGIIYIPFGKEKNEKEWIHTSNYYLHETLNEIPEIDVIFFTMKAHSMERSIQDTLDGLKRCNPTIFLTMNGLGLKGIVAKYLPSENIVECVVNYPSILEGNCVKNDGGNSIIIFEKNILAESLIPQLFEPNSINFKLEPNFRLVQWQKALMNIGMNAISAVPMLKVGEVLSRPALGIIIKNLIQETVSVASKLGISYEEDMTEFFWRFAGRDPDHYTSMYWDIKNNKPTEIEFLNGYIVQEGKRLGINTPANEAIYNLTKIIEKGYKLI